MKKCFLFTILFISLFYAPCVFAGVEFDDIDDILTCGNVDSSIFSEDFTISALINRGSVPWYTIVDKRSGEFAGTILAIRGDAGNQGKVFLRIGGGAGDTTSDSAVPADTWTRVTATRSGTDITIYQDVTVIGTGSNGNNGSNAEDLNIGGNAINGLYFGGGISDVLVLPVALTATQVALLVDSELAHMPLQSPFQPNVLYVPMDDWADGTIGDGLIYKDLSGNGNICTGDDGANDSGLINKAEEVLSYARQPYVMFVGAETPPISDTPITEYYKKQLEIQ